MQKKCNRKPKQSKAGIIILPTQTMHYYKENPSKLPSICCLFHSPQNGYHFMTRGKVKDCHIAGLPQLISPWQSWHSRSRLLSPRLESTKAEKKKQENNSLQQKTWMILARDSFWTFSSVMLERFFLPKKIGSQARLRNAEVSHPGIISGGLNRNVSQ